MRKPYLQCSLSVLVIIMSLVSCLPQVAAAQPGEAVMMPQLVISELQTGGLTHGNTEDGRMEFIELYNPAATSIDVADWRVEYLSASSDGSGVATRVIASLEGTIGSKSYILLSHDGYLPEADVIFGTDNTASSGLLAKSGGHGRIVDKQGATIDLVGWGSAVDIGNWWKSPEIPYGQSVQRILPGSPVFTSGLAFSLPSTATTPYGGNRPLPAAPPAPICSGVVLSEILSNPTGTDGGHEFIEIHNPTAEEVSLHGCALRLGNNGTTFTLPNEMLPPAAYRAFNDSETNIVLPNTTAQTVWLLTLDGEAGVQYANALPDNHSWALINGTWQASAQPTPGGANTLSAPVTDDEDSASGVPNELASCPSGKERSPQTNRCRNPVFEAPPAPCKQGQERNSATGRCRAVVSTASVLTPCKEGQTRSPETNRCRSVLAANTASKPCAPGQERNPDTNRCRKAAPTAASLAKVQDIATPSTANNMRWWIISLVAAGVLGYAVYEWRRDILNVTHKFKTKFSRNPPD